MEEEECKGTRDGQRVASGNPSWTIACRLQWCGYPLLFLVFLETVVIPSCDCTLIVSGWVGSVNFLMCEWSSLFLTNRGRSGLTQFWFLVIIYGKTRVSQAKSNKSS